MLSVVCYVLCVVCSVYCGVWKVNHLMLINVSTHLWALDMSRYMSRSFLAILKMAVKNIHLDLLNCTDNTTLYMIAPCINLLYIIKDSF